MIGIRPVTTLRSNVVQFFAAEITESNSAAFAHANDNCCPHCGGVLEPGDKASDCSGSRAQPMRPRPQDRVC